MPYENVIVVNMIDLMQSLDLSNLVVAHVVHNRLESYAKAFFTKYDNGHRVDTHLLVIPFRHKQKKYKVPNLDNDVN